MGEERALRAYAGQGWPDLASNLADTWDRLADERDREARHDDVPSDRAVAAAIRAAQLRTCAVMLRHFLKELRKEGL